MYNYSFIQECIPVGCLPPACCPGGVPGPRGVSAPEGREEGCLVWGGVCSQGGDWSGDGIPACTEADSPPVNRITDTCKNITLPQLSLRAVINDSSGKEFYYRQQNQRNTALVREDASAIDSQAALWICDIFAGSQSQFIHLLSQWVQTIDG